MVNSESAVDVAVIGAGIVGLAFAWEAARRGNRVAVFERDPQAQGASIRNFGMVWPIGQPPGDQYQTALRSRARWLELAEEKVLWVNPCGSLHAVNETDENEVLREFVEAATQYKITCEYLDPLQTAKQFPVLNTARLKGSLFSPTELAVDPREAIAKIPNYLREKLGVQFYFNSTIVDASPEQLKSSDGRTWNVKRIIVASGVDFETLFPETYRKCGIKKCKLQMLRTLPQPKGWRLPAHLAGGLTLTHYKSFEICRTLAAVKSRVTATMPEYVKYGIHVMASQNELGEVILGDSHEYGEDVSIFNNERIDTLILDYLAEMLQLPEMTIASRWHGFYAKHPAKPFIIESPKPGITIVSAPGGAGMTMSFGYAANWWDQQ